MKEKIILLKRILMLYSISQDVFINGSTYNKIERNLKRYLSVRVTIYGPIDMRHARHVTSLCSSFSLTQ